MVARQLGLSFVGSEISTDYLSIAHRRIASALRDDLKQRVAHTPTQPDLFGTPSAGGQEP